MSNIILEVGVAEFETFGLVDIFRNIFANRHDRPKYYVNLTGRQCRGTCSAVDLHEFDIAIETLANFGEHCGIESGGVAVSGHEVEWRQIARHSNLERLRAVNFRNVDLRDVVFVDVADVVVGTHGRADSDIAKVSLDRSARTNGGVDLTVEGQVRLDGVLANKA